MKKEAGQRVKKHYLLSVAVCLMAMLFSSSFVNQMEDSPVLDAVREVTGTELGQNRISISTESYWTVMEDIADNNIDSAKDQASNAMESYRNEDHNVFGRSQGVIADVLNKVTSGEILVLVYNGISSFIDSPNIVSLLLIIAAAFIQLAFVVFVKNMLELVMNRLFMEGSTYDHVPIQHAFYFDAVDKWIKAGLAYLRYTVQLALWYLTVIGGFIKTYSYAMVPYLLAENPDLTGKEAIALSRKMMDGHKLELFKLDLSMAGWYVLDVLTVGISGILWSNPYYTATKVQYYRYLRSTCKEAQLEGAEAMNDTYLFELPDDETLARAYRDVKMDQMYIRDNEVTLTGAKKFFVENLSIWIGSTKEKKTWQAIESIKAQIASDEKVLAKEAYPSRLSPLYVRARKHYLGQRNYVRAYTVQNLILMFFSFAFIGWIWEVALCIYGTGQFVNRGTLMGPYLPIYGVGAVLALVLLTRLRNHPLATFNGALVLSGVIEFTTGTVLETMYGMRWWDYTGYFLNIDGKICLEGLLIFAIGCMAVIYAIAPELDNLYDKANSKILTVITVILTVVFVMDVAHSIKSPNCGDNITSSNVPLIEEVINS